MTFIYDALKRSVRISKSVGIMERLFFIFLHSVFIHKCCELNYIIFFKDYSEEQHRPFIMKENIKRMRFSINTITPSDVTCSLCYRGQILIMSYTYLENSGMYMPLDTVF